MLFDTHMHCAYSCDSHMDIADAIGTAASQDLGIIVTEHWDYDYPTNPDAFTFDIDEYFKIMRPLRSDNMLIGIEIGMQAHTATADDAIAAAHDFDYVLASIHCAGRKDLYERRFYEGRPRAEAVDGFLRDTLACIENHQDFDAFAHIDYICRYWPYDGAERELHLDDNPLLWDKILQLLADRRKPMEINTRRLDDEAACAALLPIYRRYRALGGRFCTLGSDAHYAEHVGRRLYKAMAMAKEADLIPVYFRQREMLPMEVE